MPYNLDMFARSKMASALKVGDEVEVIGGDKVVTAKVTAIKGKWIEVEGFPRKFSIGTGKYRGNGALIWEMKEMEAEQQEVIEEDATDVIYVRDKESGVKWVKAAKVSASIVTAIIKRIEGWDSTPDDLRRALIRTAAEYLARNI